MNKGLQTGLVLALALYGQIAAAHGDEDHSKEAKPAGAPAEYKAGTAAAAAGESSPARLPDGSVRVPKGSQRQLAIRTVVAKIEEHSQSVELNGRVMADPNAGGPVQASQPGRIEPGPRGLPVLGQAVVRGQVLAYLRPVANAIERGNQQAQLAELTSQLGLAEKKVKRLEELEGSVPRKEVETARAEFTSLGQRKHAVDASLNQREALIAPVTGVVSAASALAGQVVEARETLFEIVDPKRLLVEALAYDAAVVANIAGASGATPGGVLELAYLGGGAQLREQALPLQFRIKPPLPPLAVGQPVKVIAQLKQRIKAIALPVGALVRNSSGETVVWVHEHAERFVQKRVRSQPLDAARAAVLSGIAEGERVVTSGAAAIAQVR